MGLVGFVAFLLLRAYNLLVLLDERCDTAFADVDVHLKNRQTILPGLVEAVRGYAAHEREIFIRVAEAQAQAARANGVEARAQAEDHLSQNISALVSYAQSYPQLQGSEHFKRLRQDLSDAENRIAASRRFYNLAVQEFNASARQFPGALVVRLFPMMKRAPYDLGAERVLIDEPLAFKF
jgi:LemA protein